MPLFPLPGTVLLPGGVLPLHVFEPRYRAMVRDALAGERLIAMALLRPGYDEQEYEGAPEIEPAVCVGRVALEQQLADGRWNMVLVGLCRARITGEDRSRPYRLADVALLSDPPLDEDSQLAEGARLAARLERIPPRLVKDAGRLQTARELLARPGQGDLALGLRLDLTADQFHLTPAGRQRLLETAGVPARGALLLELLEARAAELERLGLRPAWPPALSPY